MDGVRCVTFVFQIVAHHIRGDIMEATANRWTDEKSVGKVPPYVAVFQVNTATTLPDREPFEKFQGLILCQLMEVAENDVRHFQVYTLWSSAEHFRVVQDRFRHYLRTAQGGVGDVTLQWKAPQNLLMARKPPRDSKQWLWTLWLVFVHIATVAGVAEVIRNHYDWLFVAPQLALVSPTKQHNFHKDDEADLNIQLRNLTPSGTSEVNVHRIKLIPVTAAKADSKSERPEYVLLEPAEPIQLRMAPNDVVKIDHNWPSIPAGEYEIHTEATQKAGSFHGEKEWKFTTQRARIWRDIHVHKDFILESQTADKAVVKRTISVGQPNKGLQILATLPRENVKISYVLSDQMAELKEPQLIAGIWQLEWRTGPVMAKRDIGVRIYLERVPSETPGSPESWQSIAEAIDLYADLL